MLRGALVALLAWGLAAQDDPVLAIELDDASFLPSIAGRRSFVKFFSPTCGHCRAMEATWEALADAMDDVFVAGVDCTKPQSANTCAAMEVAAYPTLKLVEENIVYDYTGERELASLKAFATKGYRRVKGTPLRRAPPATVDDRFVMEVTDANLTAVEASGKTVMLEFFAPWCGMCQQMVPAFNELAQTLAKEHPDLLAVKCDATVWTASARRYRVKGYPTLKVLHNGQVYNYDGQRDATSMLEFLLNPTGTPASIPGQWDFTAQVMDFVDQLGRDVELVLKYKQTAALAIYVLGLLSGCVFVLLVALVLPHPRAPRPKPRAPPTAAPAAPAPTDQERKDQ